jgi:hypothetical protein
MRKTLTAAALVALTALAIGAAHAGEESAPERKRIVWLEHGAAGGHAEMAEIEGDRVKIEDLDTLLPGESRSYYTEANREVVVTRGEGDRYTVEVEGKKVEIGGELDELAALNGVATTGEAGEQRRIVVHRQHRAEGDAAAAEGEATKVERDVVVRMAHGLAAVETEGGEPPVVIEIVGGDEGKVERRIVVLRLDAAGDEQ